MGGTRGEGSGFFVRPTLFVDATPDMRIVREEIFGPVGVIIKFKTEEEAVAQANDTEYGLAAYVHTQNVNCAIRVAHALESGQAFVSCFLPCRRTRLMLGMFTGQLVRSDARKCSIRRRQAIRPRQGTGRSSPRSVRNIPLYRCQQTNNFSRYTNVKTVHINLGLNL